MKSKKKMTTTALAVALAVLLLIGGGTFAYLQSTTGDVKNNFNANQVTVSLEETTGNNYNIIPGTEQSKDPKVTVNNTVDAYVYVEVTDTTQELVEYSIADGWTPLDGFEGVYYREVAKSTDSQVFSVLEGDKVSYSTALENSNMLDADGNLKAGVELTFKAHAIQKEGFVSAAAAYQQVLEPKKASSVADINAAMADGRPITLTDNITLDKQIEMTKDFTLDGAGKTLTAQNGDNERVLNMTDTTKDINVKLSDATLAGPTEGTNTRGIAFYNNSGKVRVDIDKCDISAAYYAVNVAGKNADIALDIKNSKIDGWCAYQTWSAGSKATFDSCILTGINDKKYNADGWNNFATIVINEDATDSTITFKDCTINANQTTGNNQYFASVRTVATLTFENCKFLKDGKEITDKDEILKNFEFWVTDANVVIK